MIARQVRRIAPVLVALAGFACAAPETASPWPQAGGPTGSWSDPDAQPPLVWSVARGENVVWRTPLPEAGQSGICVVDGRLFVTTLAPWDPGSADAPNRPFSKDVVGWCLDARTGAVLWSVAIPGVIESPNLYAYSDVSSPTPCTDGARVFFVNAGGGIACCDLRGAVQWRRAWRPWADGYPFNKQFEPFVAEGCLVNLEPRDADDPKAAHGWNFLRGLDATSGETAWIADDGTTSYCTPVLGRATDGRPAVLHGRGGWHGVPEEPVGLSLTSVARPDAGRTLWRYVASTDRNGDLLERPGTEHAPTWQALYVQHWDAARAYWFVQNPVESHIVIDARTGTELARQSLVEDVDWRRFDLETGRYVVHRGVDLRTMVDPAPRMAFDRDKNVLVVQPAWHCNIVTHGYHWFLCSTAHGRNAAPNRTRPDRVGIAGPSHCLGRVDLATGEVEYLELPVNVLRAPDAPDALVFGVAQRTSTLNSRGVDPAAEDRSRTDGWQIPAFWASPTVLGDAIYFTTTLGLVYVVDANARQLDELALLAVNDLGPIGETWAMGSLAYADGRIFHRTAKDVVCVGR